ncbi:MAG: glycoside hydrolase family 78 protein [Anaerolineae bacterium]
MTTTLTRLRCDYLENPLGIDNPQPRFAWQLVSDERAAVQSAYQIVVRDATAVLWDTGKVGSVRSLHVPYGGPPLASCQRCTWAVRVWDGHGAPSAWSEEASFEVGLLSHDDWQARWIEPVESEDPRAFKPCPYLRREFNTENEIESARLYITSHGLYEAWLNGVRVGDQVFTPGCTPYDLRLQYQVYYVTSQLSAGANALGVILGDGWYRSKTGIGNLRNVYGKHLGLLAQLVIKYSDGTAQVVVADDAWRSSTGPLLKSDLKDGEVYDARLELDGWERAGYDDSAWQAVRVVDVPLTNLSASCGVPVRRRETFTPVAVLHTPNGETVLDMGQNIAGVVRMRVEAPAGTAIKLSHGETLDRDGNFTMANLNLNFGNTKDPLLQEVHYTCRGGGAEVYEPHFTVHGFRYVRVEGLPYEPIPEQFTAVAIYSDMAPTGSFECSNPLVNQLMHNILWSMKGNFLDIPTDCPTRERAGWTGDAQIFARTGSFLMETAPFFRKWLRDLALEQFPSGLVTNWVPNPQRPLKITRGMMPALEGSSGWGDAAVIIPWTLYQVYGDTRILEEQYASMRAWVEYERRTARAIPWYKWLNPALWFNQALRRRQQLIWDTKYQWGEWLEPDEGYGLKTPLGVLKRLLFGEPLVATAYYAHSCGLLAEAARVLGKEEDARTYSALAGEIRRAYAAQFIKADGSIKPNKQASYVRALAFDLVPEAQRAAVLERLVDKIRAAGTHIGTGFLSTPFLCPVLAENGQLALAYELLNQTTIPSWLYAVTKGATTVWESWTGITPDGKVNGSFNHYSYGAVASWLVQTVAGLEIGAPGYQQIMIQPQPGGGLTWALASYRSLYGEISSGWEINGGRFSLSVVIPPNTRATVRLPGAVIVDEITESGLPLEQAPGIAGWREDQGDTVIELGSGEYEFNYPYSEPG